MKTTINGLEVENITYKNPGNNLPKFVREAAETRGYGDSTQTLSLFVQQDDVSEAFACAAQGNGSSCVMAQAGTRIGAKAVYFYRTTAWIDFGDGPIVRFATSKAIYTNVIAPAPPLSRHMPRVATFEHLFYSQIMTTPTVDHTATIWMTNDIPERMVYAGRRWRITDMPTRLRHSSWSVAPGEVHTGLNGWRFQGADDDGITFVFDVYEGADGWHVHRTYE